MPETSRTCEIAAEAAPRAEPAAARARARCADPSVGPPASAAPRADGGEQIGISGERLTRDEAFDLVRRAVAVARHGR